MKNMSVDKTSVRYMKEYLGYALKFEKYVYIWSKALANTNKQLNEVRTRKKSAQSSQLSSQKQLSTLNYDFVQYEKREQEEIFKYKKRSKFWLTAAIVWLAFSIIVAVGFAFLSPDISSKSLLIKIWAIVFITAMYFCLVLFIGPICLYQHSKNKKTYKKLRSKAANGSFDLKDRKQTLLIEQYGRAETTLEAITKEEIAIIKKQNTISGELQKAKRNLSEIYSINALPQKYRTFNAVATLYEYLDTGRCNVVQGHGGIYDTYEIERISLEQLAQMVMMNQTISRIEDNQRYICSELRQANKALSNISSSVKEIQKTNAEIAKNTAISAIANQQTAEATSWLAWRAWANGY